VIIFVRHGETAPNRDGLVLGRADPELTDRGADQALRVAEALKAEKITHIWTSPLQRAVQTAAAITEATGCPAVVDERLLEVDWGAWEGRQVSGVGSAEIERYRASGGEAPEGESLQIVRDRVVSFCLEALETIGDGVGVAVSHVSPVKAAVAWALEADDTAAMRMFLGLASITRIDHRERGPILLSFNETGHLRPA
jgi:broad specificity phosphatase PhoE